VVIFLPLNTKRLIQRYKNLKIGKYKIQCPYFQNIAKKNGRSVYIGKGLPGEIEMQTEILFKSLGKDLNSPDPSTIRHYMVMAGLGIDCSGFAVRIIDNLLREKGTGSIRKNLRPNHSLLSLIRFFFRPYTNLSAANLTSNVNCIKVKNIKDVLPGDLIKIGKGHVALVTKVKKENNKVKKINYCHSTSDYYELHGVRSGEIIISSNSNSLSKQKWTEYYRGRNWMLEDYLKANKNERGIRRLKTSKSL